MPIINNAALFYINWQVTVAMASTIYMENYNLIEVITFWWISLLRVAFPVCEYNCSNPQMLVKSSKLSEFPDFLDLSLSNVTWINIDFPKPVFQLSLSLSQQFNLRKTMWPSGGLPREFPSCLERQKKMFFPILSMNFGVGGYDI